MKRTVVTAALPYANGELHLGHVKSTYLPADIFTRFMKFKGLPTVYVCASDEHGTPILFRSEKQGVKPEEYILKWRQSYFDDLSFVLIDFDKFYHTHSSEHIKITQEVYEKLKEKGYIKKLSVKQYWCPKENKPLPDRYVIGTCPFCEASEQYGDQCEKCGKVFTGGQLVNAICKTCGAKAEIRESEHVFFTLSNFSDKLEKFVENVDAPKDIKNFVLGWINDGLKDWDIERDISWGVPIPDSKGVFYVWFDAPIAYTSTLKKWCDEKGEKFEDWWDNIVHFIGKDIAYHHFLFWPAILMGVDWKLPSMIPVRGHLTLEQKKFSKSRQWYISIKQWKELGFSPEYLRFFMTYTTPQGMKDSDFSAREFQKVINEELVNNFGNLLQRTLKFSERLGSKIEDVETDEIFKKVQESVNKYEKFMDETKLSEALKIAVGLIHELNVYFQRNEPWKNLKIAPKVIRTVASSLVILNKLLYPILPLKSKKVAKLLNVDLVWEGKDALKVGHTLNKAEILFPKVDDDMMKKLEGLYKK